MVYLNIGLSIFNITLSDNFEIIGIIIIGRLLIIVYRL